MTFEGIVLVASSLPPSPASITAASTRAAARATKRGGGRQLELGHRLALLQAAVDRLGRLRGPLDRRGELGGADLLAVDQDPFGPARRVRRDAGAGG